MKRSNFKILSYLLITIILTLGLSISFQSLLAAWTAPLGNPPTCLTGDPGCDEPINKGSLLQSKGGPLLINTDNSATTGLVVYGNVGVGTISPAYKLEVEGGAIKATGGLIIETRTTDPAIPVPGQIWLRTDL